MTDELNLETTVEEELDELAELDELDEIEEEAPKKRRVTKRKVILIGGIALGLAIAAILAVIFTNRARRD